MNSEQIVIYSAKDSQQAHLLRNQLESIGIRAYVWNDSLQGALGDLPITAETAPCVVVAREDADEARQIAMAFETGRPLPASDTANQERDDWPSCPECARPRAARCPHCRMPTADAPLASYVPLTDGLPAERLHLCSVCDEAFLPEFYRRCEQCSFDFGDGIEVEKEEREEISNRAVGVAAALCGLALLVLGYFWLVLS